MRFAWLLGALSIVAITNAFVLAHVERNRVSSTSQMDLDMRELEGTWMNSADDSREHIHLRWNNPSSESRIWLDRARLQQLGFDTARASQPGAAPNYKMPSREVFVALEFNGPALDQWRRDQETKYQAEAEYNRQQTVDERIEIERITGSRLVAIDVARDPSELRRKYPDGARVMILRGLVQMVNGDYGPTLRGQIQRLENDEIFVPEEFRAPLPHQYIQPWTLNAQKQIIYAGSPFTATLKVGENYEPWLADVRPNQP